MKSSSNFHLLKIRYIVTALLLGLLLISTLFLGLRFFRSMGFENVSKPPVALNSTGIVSGVNVDITAMIPDTPYTITTTNDGNFFDLATQLGINTLRITDVRWETTGEEYSGDTWHQVFNEAQNHHLKIILLLIGNDNETAIQQAHILLGQYGLAKAPALWMVDLDNEPVVSDEQVLHAIQEEAAYVHQVAPGIPVTIGGWKSQASSSDSGEFNWQDPADIPKFINLVDVVSPHLYGFDQGKQQGFTPKQWTRLRLNAVRQVSQGKPILIEEFGAGNGIAPTTGPDPIGSPEWQASVYQGVLQEVAAEHNQAVLGSVAWIFAPRPSFPPGPTNYQKNMAGWAFVLNNGKQILPAAHEFINANK